MSDFPPKYKQQTVVTSDISGHVARDTCQDVHALSPWITDLPIIISHKFLPPVTFTATTAAMSLYLYSPASTTNKVRCEVCSVALYCLSTNLDSWELLLPAQYAVSVSWSPHHLHRRKMDLTGALWTSAPACWPSHYIFTIYIPIFHSANGEHSAVLEVLILLKCKAKRCLELQSYKCIFVEDIKLTLLTLFQFSDFFRNEMKMS